MAIGAIDPEGELVIRTREYVEEYMKKYDASHDFQHVVRVFNLAQLIASESKKKSPTTEYNHFLIKLAALMHDVGDKKYLLAGQDASSMVKVELLRLGAESEVAEAVQTIVSAVSYSSEIKDPETVKSVLIEFPELAVVQDADRLDAIGAIGIGRCFTFGGAKGVRSMGDSVGHFEDKLEKLEGMMKTEVGKQMARERTRRLKEFQEWWRDEIRESSPSGAAYASLK